MAPPAPALRLLTLALFLFMIGQGISARDLKVEQQDQKQVDSNGATPVSSDVPYKQHDHPSHHGNTDQPYITGYITTTPPGTRKANQPSYSASYGTVTHDSDEPYLTGYKTTTPPGTRKDNQPNYIASYGTVTHDSNEPYLTGYKTTTPPGTRKDNQLNYIASYGTVSHDSNEPYLTGYKTTTPPGTRKDNQPNYIAAYKTYSGPGTHEPNQPYSATYKAHSGPGTHEPNRPYAAYTAHSGPGTHEPNQPYSTTYKAHSGPGTHESNQPYSATYRAHSGPGTHKPNQPYIASYKSTSFDSNQHVFDAKTAPKDSSYAHDTTEPYITAYGGGKDPKESISTQDSTKPYVTQYGSHPHKDSKGSAAQESSAPYITQFGNISPKHDPKDSGEPYITAYGGKKDPKESTLAKDSGEQYLTKCGNKTPKESTSTQDSGEQYMTQYGDGTPKNDPKVSTQGYEARYKEKSKNVDHTEAFKTGFFALGDLYAGNVMTLQFPVQEISHFLSRKEANYIPFSSSQLPSVLQLFSIPEDSPKAKSMRGTLEQCEGEPITGERKICATSLESMLEFVDSVIGSNTKYDLLTTSHPTPTGSPLQKYTILEVSQDIEAPKWAACHPLPYSYAVYYCHFISTGTKVFKVSLGGENGDRVEALGVCHLDTSDWSPSQIIFKQLGIEAGKAPVCHFFPIKHLMWVPQPSKASM